MKYLLVTDADNTLWETDGLYAHTQLELLSRIEQNVNINSDSNDRLAFVRQVDQGIAKVHHLHLRYPPELLVQALALILNGESVQKAIKSVISSPNILGSMVDAKEHAIWFLNTLQSGVPKLRKGVREGLFELKKLDAYIVIATEGNRDKCANTLDYYEIGGFFDKLLTGNKTGGLFNRLIKLGNEVSPYCYLVGDQLDRDIIPGKQAGFITFYFPGGFKPVWTPDESSVNPDYKIKDFFEIPRIIETELSSKLSFA